MSLYLFKRVIFNCRRATLLAVKRDARSISFLERLELSYHLLYCDPCRRFVTQNRMLDDLGKQGDSTSLDPPFTMAPPLRERIQRELTRLG